MLVTYSTLETLQKTADIQAKLYHALERRLEGQAQHIGKLVDNIDANHRNIVNTVDMLSERINKMSLKVEEHINQFSDKLMKSSDRMSEFEKKIIGFVDKKSELDLKTYNNLEQNIFDRIEFNTKKVDSLEKKINTFTRDVNEAETRFRGKMIDKGRVLGTLVKETYERHSKAIQRDMAEMKKIHRASSERASAELEGLWKDVRALHYLKQAVKEINKKNKEDVMDSVNERMNNFKEDVEDRLTLKETKGEDKEVLKRLAHLEGVKEAITHRKSAKEVIHKLQEAQMLVLENERKGIVDKEAQSKVDALLWVLGGGDARETV